MVTKNAAELRSNTLSAQDIQTAVKLCIPGELGKHAVQEATTALVKYRGTTRKDW